MTLRWMKLSEKRLVYLGFPIVFAMLSLRLGQPSDWDTLNYHLYNPFAWIHGRVGSDLAPAGFQSYFNPLVDVPFYLLWAHAPAPLAGLIFGAVHGLAGVLVFAIAHRVLPSATRAPLWLAIAGVLSANYLSELGTSMGDDTTSLVILAAIYCVIRANEPDDSRPVANRWLLGAGLLAGAGVGLKLTNAPLVVALGLGVLASTNPPWRGRVGRGAIFAVATAAGFIAVGGYWLAHMWHLFGNPLFPQFGKLFPNPLASTGVVADTSWLPRTWWEYLVWPFIISWDTLRSGQVRLRTMTWALLYVAYLLALALPFVRRRAPRGEPLSANARLLVTLLAVGFTIWMGLFSVMRYLVPIELLAPLVTWILILHLSPTLPSARLIGAILLALAAAFTLSGGVKSWGHQKWAIKAFSAEPPSQLIGGKPLVVFGAIDPPMAWLATQLPPGVTYASIGGAFYEGQAYISRLALLRAGADAVYLALPDQARPTALVESILLSLGGSVDLKECSPHEARVGAKRVRYQLCQVEFSNATKNQASTE
jgi:hypothetical protein